MANGAIQALASMVNLQVAAEAFLNGAIPDTLENRLILGNHSLSIEPALIAAQFKPDGQYILIAHQDLTLNSSLTNPSLLDKSGFSASIFLDTTTGQYTLSIRSTEWASTIRDLGDVLADYDALFNSGWAFAQIQSLETFWQAVQKGAPPASLGITVPDPVALTLFQSAIAAGSKVNVTGYSLGGNVASAFAELHVAQVQHAYDFNALGTGIALGGVSAAYKIYAAAFDNPFSVYPTLSSVVATGDALAVIAWTKLTADRSATYASVYDDPRYVLARAAVDSVTKSAATITAASPLVAPRQPSGQITDIVASNYLNSVVPDSGAGVSGMRHGDLRAIWYEDQPLTGGSPGGDDSFLNFDWGTGHSIVLLQDSLNLMALFEQLAPNITENELAAIFGAASNHSYDSLERSLDAISKLFGIAAPVASATADSQFAQMSLRNVLYQRISDIQTSSAFGQLVGKLDIQVSDATSITARARDDFSAFIALTELSPICIVAIDASAAANLQLAWSQLYASEYNAWQADRSMRASGQQASNFTDAYLSDRQALLHAVTLQNQQNITTGVVSDSSVPGDRFYEFHYYGGTPQQAETQAPLQILIADPSGAGVRKPGQVIWFGNDADNQVTGGDNSLIGDHLYGGAGNDSINGRAGCDYIEGNVGDDTLNGGRDSDTLVGGAGTDTYTFASGDGLDNILDSDGLGKIVIDGTTLTGGKAIALSGQVWADSNNSGVRYTLVPNAAGGKDLWINYGTANKPDLVVLKNYAQGELGIQLQDAAPSPAPSSGPADLAIDPTGYQDPTEVDSSSYILKADSGSGYASSLISQNVLISAGSASSGYHLELDWNGHVSATGNGTIIGGSGSDYLFGAFNLNSNNLVIGGGGSDHIETWRGNSRIYADQEVSTAAALEALKTAVASGAGVFIDSVNGNNTIVGGNGGDVIETADGYSGQGIGPDETTFRSTDNVVVTGAGADTVIGGANQYYLLLPAESVARWGLNSDLNRYLADSHFITTAVLNGVDNDTVYGGDGNNEYWFGNGNNYLQAGNGNDFIRYGTGSNSIFGGSGNDTIVGASDGVGGAVSSTTLGPDQFRFTVAGGDSFFVGNGFALGMTQPVPPAGSTYILTGDGNDLVVALGGSNVIVGGAGNNTIYSGNSSAMWASSGANSWNYIFSGSGNSTAYGSAGQDTLVSGSIAGSGRSSKIYAGNGSEWLIGGAGADSLYGGSGSNTINAGDGNTLITAGSGNTTINGGAGSDTIHGGTGVNVISAGDGGTFGAPTIVRAGSGNTTIYGGAGVNQLYGGAGSVTLVAGSGTSTLQGGSGTEVMYGGSGNATLMGGTGDVIFHGGIGNITIFAGGGSNTYLDMGMGNVEVVGSSGSGVFEFGAGVGGSGLAVGIATGADGAPALTINTGGGTVTIDNGLGGAISQFTFADGSSLTLDQLISQSYAVPTSPVTVARAHGNSVYALGGGNTLAGGVGNDTLVAWNGGNQLVAGTGNQALYGKSGNDTLVGGSGDDTLVSAVGDSTLIGGTGNTTFVVNSATDIVQAQLTGSNVNTVESSVDYVLPDNVQNLIGTGSADLVLAGNALVNTIVANTGNDTLIAGAGMATLAGGSGNNTFLVNNAGDVVQAQSTGENVNTIESSVSYALPDNVQYLTLIGADNLVGTGNDLDNVITGNAGNDTLIAAGGNDTLVAGSGLATMVGGAGNDVFVVNNTGDVVQAQTTGGNINMIVSSVNYVLPDNVQFLALIGADNLVATGNDSDNFIAGNAGNDTLVAGSGNDTLAAGSGGGTLMGGAGADTFVLNAGGAQQTIFSVPKANGDVLQFSEEVSIGDVRVFQQGADLLVKYGQDGSALIKDFAPDGVSGKQVISRFDFADGSGAYVTDGQGTASLNAYRDDGSLSGDFWQSGDSYGNDVYSEGGASIRTTYSPDGTRTTVADDGEGTVTTTNYDAGGNEVGASWTGSDGAYGNTVFHEDGSSEETRHAANGSYTALIRDAQGNEVTTWFGVAGNKIKDAWVQPLPNGDAAYGNDSFNPNGTYAYSFSSDGGFLSHGDGNFNTRRTYFDGNGVKTSDEWHAADDSFGTDNFRIDGSSDGVSHEADGSHSTYANDGRGDTRTTGFDSDGAKRSAAWTEADGSYGGYTFNADGTISGTRTNADGTTVGFTDIGSALTAWQPVSGQAAAPGQAWNFTVPDAAFLEAGGDETLAYSAALADGSPLPSWISFDPASRAFSGTPGSADVGDLLLTVMATDSAGLQASATFALNVDQTPIVSQTIDDQSAIEGSAWAFVVPASTFTDPDAGDVLSFSATLADGAALPDWLSFDAHSQTFSGTPPLGQSATLSVQVTATDQSGAGVSTSFDLALQAPDTVYTPVSYTAGPGVLNIVGTGGDNLLLKGNSLANTIAANSGDDTLVAGSGVATLIGGLGSDVFRINNIADVVVAQMGATHNTVVTSVSYVAPDNVQQLTGSGTADLALAGAAQGIVIVGNAGNDTLTSGSGDATLIAGTGLATLVGGMGHNLFRINNTGDTIQLQMGALGNTVQTSVSYTATAGVQKVVGIGSADLALRGGSSRVAITGNGGNDTLIAGSGDATLIAGTGLATLVGGSGNNLFCINDTGDTIQLQIGALGNTVQTSVSYTATAGVQKVVGMGSGDLTLSGGWTPVTITGNGGNDTLIAGSGDATLIAGSGLATLVGGSGNNVFRIDNTGDVIQTQAESLSNTVVTSVSYVAQAGVQKVTGFGTADITLTGNNLANVLVGNGGNDTLIAGSGDAMLVAGTGLATLVGGSATNTFKINDSEDVVIAQAGATLNAVITTADFAAAANVQTVTAVGTSSVELQAGTGDVTLTGNAGSDTLIGGSGNAMLVAGSGVSTLVGGSGSTTFKINNAADVVTQQAGAGLAVIQAKVNYVLPDNVQDLFLTGGSSLIGKGNANGGVNLIVGNAGSDTLEGGTGVSVLESGAGRASMSASAAAVMLGGAKADKLTAGAAGAFTDGGAGADTITLGSADSVIAFNQGDGRDTLVGGGSDGNVLSLGGGIAEGNLTFSKSGTNLILTTGPGDAIVFQNWYATGAVHEVSTLQLIEEASSDYNAGSSNVLVNSKIEEFDFAALVNAFDTARAGNSTLKSWNLMNDLLSAHLASSDAAALGGDLAYWDGLNGKLTGMDLTAAAFAVSDPNFGKTAQNVHGWNTISQLGNPII